MKTFTQKHFLSLVILFFLIIHTLLFVVNTNSIQQSYSKKLQLSLLTENRIKSYVELNTNYLIRQNKVDIFNNCVSLSTGITPTYNDDLIKKTLLSPSLFTCENLIKFLNTGDFSPGNEPESHWNDPKNYGRFWNGIQVVLKPLVILTGVNFTDTLLKLITILVFCIFMFISILKLREFSLFVLAPFFLAFNSDIISSYNTQILYIIILGLTIYLFKINFSFTKHTSILLFIFGYFYWFISYLMYPTLIVMIPLTAYTVYILRNKIRVTKILLKNISKIIIWPLAGIFTAFTFKLLIFYFVNGNQFGPLRDSQWNYLNWGLKTAVKNQVQFINPSLLISLLIISILFIRMDFSDEYLFLVGIVFLVSLSYFILLPEHSIHSFALGSLYGLTASLFLTLRLFAGVFLHKNSIFSLVKNVK